MSQQEWLILRSGKEFGPYDDPALTKMARAGLLLPTDTVIDWSTKTSIVAYELPNLFPEYVPPQRPTQLPQRPLASLADRIEKKNTPVLVALAIAAITICFVFLASATYMNTTRIPRFDPSLTRAQSSKTIALQQNVTSSSGGSGEPDLFGKCQGLPVLDKPGENLPALPANIQGQWYVLAASTDKGRNAEVIASEEKSSHNWVFNEKSVEISTNDGYPSIDLVPSDAEETANMHIPIDSVSSFGYVEGMPTYMLHSSSAKEGVVWFCHYDSKTEQVLWRSIKTLENKETNRLLLGRDPP